MCTGRAGRHHSMVRALETVFDGDMAGDEVDQPAGHEERADAAVALFLERDRRFLDAVQAADARADQHAGAAALFLVGRHPAGILHGLLGCRQAVEDEIVDALDRKSTRLNSSNYCETRMLTSAR